MGDTLDYIDSECEDWADEIDALILEGASLDEAVRKVGAAPLPDCYEYIMEM